MIANEDIFKLKFCLMVVAQATDMNHQSDVEVIVRLNRMSQNFSWDTAEEISHRSLEFLEESRMHIVKICQQLT